MERKENCKNLSLLLSSYSYVFLRSLALAVFPCDFSLFSPPCSFITPSFLSLSLYFSLSSLSYISFQSSLSLISSLSSVSSLFFLYSISSISFYSSLSFCSTLSYLSYLSSLTLLILYWLIFPSACAPLMNILW